MCGIFGIFAPQEEVARLTFFGLLSLQHRGQESAGIAVSNFRKITFYKNLGLVNQVFNEEILKKLRGNSAIGHTRYSTTGSSEIKNAQPIVLSSVLGDIALAHNGNLANFKTLKKFLLKKGHSFNSETDSELLTRLIVFSSGRNWREKIINGLSLVKGAFSLVILTKDKLYLIRDPWGIRPLILGRINHTGWLGASETPAIEAVGAEVIREVEPGEFIEISKGKIEVFYKKKARKTGFCIFEYVYFSRPDNIINNRLVQEARVKMGRFLAKQAPVKADMVVSVPDSGTSAALGFAQESNIPYQEGLIKSRYVGRTFIQPNQRIRDLGVRIKFSPLKKIIKNKRIVLVDDSIVRGTTIAKIIKLIKDAGAKEVHVRIASPPFKNICYLGVDVSRYRELIAAKKNIKAIKEEIGAESLAYLTLSNLKKAVGKSDVNFCTGCFDGDYPVKLEGQPFKKRLAILISDTGKGTNLQAIINGVEEKLINADILAVISDTPKAYGIIRAKKHNLPTYIINQNDQLINLLKEKFIDYIVLAGWKKIVPKNLIENYPKRILNLHPGLIPDTLKGKVRNPDGTYGLWNRGLLAEKAIKNFLEKKATYAGSSIHFLTEEFDFGPVLARCFEKILPNDKVDSLYSRLKKKENQMYVKVLAKLCH